MHAKRRVGIDDVSIGFIRDSGGNTVNIEGTTQVMEQWGEQRAEFEGSPEADWSITMDDETLSYNGVLSQSVEAWSAPIPIAVDGEVQVFNDPLCTEYFSGGDRTECYVRANVGFGLNEGKEWNEGSYTNSLEIITPTTEFPDDEYGVKAYADFLSDKAGAIIGPIEPGNIIKCVRIPGGPTISSPKTIFY